MKTIIKWIAVPVIAGALLAGCQKHSASSDDLIDAPRIDDARLVVIEGTRNTRDLGGYQMADGRTIKHGMMFRSDNLAHLTETGKAEIAALNIKAVTDLRSDKEREQEPDQLPMTTPPIDYAVLPINDKPVDIRKISRKIIMGRIDEDEVMTLLDHRRFITNSAHRESWGNWLKSLASDDKTPHLFHCTSGKDRAGFGSVIFLLTLGADKDTAMEDFLFSNAVLKGYNDATIAGIEDKIGKRDSLEIIRKIMGVSQETLEATFAEMEAQFGSVDAFIEEGLGIDAETRARLQDKFLEG